MATRKTITGLTPSQEQVVVSTASLALADRNENAFAFEINKAMIKIATAKLAGISIDDVMDEHRSNIKQLLISLYSQSFDIFGSRILEAAAPYQLKEDIFPKTPYFDLQMSLWLRWVSSVKVTQITN